MWNIQVALSYTISSLSKFVQYSAETFVKDFYLIVVLFQF